MAPHIDMQYPGKQPWKLFLVSEAHGWSSATDSNWFLKTEVEVECWNKSLLAPLHLMVFWTLQLQGSYWYLLLLHFRFLYLCTLRVFTASILLLCFLCSILDSTCDEGSSVLIQHEAVDGHISDTDLATERVFLCSFFSDDRVIRSSP